MRPAALAVLGLAAISGASFADDIRSIAQLHSEGLLTNAEHAAAKARAIAAAFPSPSFTVRNNSSSYVTVDCEDSENKKVLTVVLTKFTTPLDLRQRSVCPEVLGYSGFTTQLVPAHVPQ